MRDVLVPIKPVMIVMAVLVAAGLFIALGY